MPQQAHWDRGRVCVADREPRPVQRGFEQQQIKPDWPAPPDVQAWTTLRGPLGHSSAPFDRLNLGARCGDRDDSVRANREWLRVEAELPAAPCWLQQVHGVAVHRFAAGDTAADAEPIADAAVTAVPGRVLAILTADCLPVAFAARDGREVAMAHAGWRGLCAGVLEATVRAMAVAPRSEEHTSEIQSLMRISYAVFCVKKKNRQNY